jgi:hypothetical protein
VKLALKEGAGSLAVDGTFVVSPLAFDGKLQIADFALPPLLSRLPAPGADLLRAGALRADLSLALTPRGSAQGAAPGADLRVAGTLGLAGLDLGEAEKTRDFGVTWKDLDVAIQELKVPGLLAAQGAGGPLSVGLGRVRLVEPDIRITRDVEGLVLPPLGGKAPAPEAEPAKAAAPEPAQPAAREPAASAEPAAPIQVDVAEALIERGRARIVDRSVKPYYKSRFDRIDLRAHGVHWPGPVVQNLVFTAKGLEGANLDVRGSLGTPKAKLDAKLVKLPLAPFNPYVTPRGYSLADGTLSFDTQAKLARDAYDSSTHIVVSQLEVGGEQGESLFQKNFGIPLTMAIGLLKDLSGDITLSVDVEGSRKGTQVGLGSIVGQALRKALIGALASPLKLLGAVVSDGKVQSLAPEPIAFLPGRAELAETGASRIEQLGGLLSSSPGIVLTLRGAIAAPDVRWLKEQDLLAELRATSGVRALGKLGQMGVRRAVRLYLEARLRGEEPTLEAEPAAWLEAEIERRTLEPAKLTVLADARAAAAQSKLVSEHGIAPARLALGPPQIEPLASAPGAAVALGRP